MSRERELLKIASKIIGEYVSNTYIDDFIYEVDELLAQPEQEPVAWRGVNFTEAEGDWLYRDIDEPFTDSNYKNVGELLYLAPPTREPLSDDEICNLYYNVNGAIHKFARAIEKAHGIGVNDESNP